MIKQSSAKEILGIGVALVKNWVEYQMTPEINWPNIEIDHVKAFCLFLVSDDQQLKEAFNWQNTEPLFEKDHQQKGIKNNF